MQNTYRKYKYIPICTPCTFCTRCYLFELNATTTWNIKQAIIIINIWYYSIINYVISSNSDHKSLNYCIGGRHSTNFFCSTTFDAIPLYTFRYLYCLLMSVYNHLFLRPSKLKYFIGSWCYEMAINQQVKKKRLSHASSENVVNIMRREVTTRCNAVFSIPLKFKDDVASTRMYIII